VNKIPDAAEESRYVARQRERRTRLTSRAKWLILLTIALWLVIAAWVVADPSAGGPGTW